MTQHSHAISFFFLAWRPHEMEIKVQFMESDSDKMEIRGAVMQLERGRMQHVGDTYSLTESLESG